jgi:primosomal protein N' (replication factor Y)
VSTLFPESPRSRRTGSRAGRALGDDSNGAHCIVRVAVERGLDRTREATHARAASRTGDGSLTYRSPVALPLGQRVEVPLGSGDTPAIGIVVETGGVELLDGLDITRIKSVLRDTGPGLPPRLVELARWISTYYICPLGMVLATMVPAAVKKGIGTRVSTLVEPEPGALDASSQRVSSLPPKLRDAWVRLLDARPAFPLSPDSLALLLGAKTRAPVNRLVKLGVLRTVEHEEVHAARGVWSAVGVEQRRTDDVLPTLTPQQAHVVDGILASLSTAQSGFGVHLIRGVTGSGKTEVYLRLIEHVLRAGKSALVLVPEISLTPQTAGRFLRRFSFLIEGANASGIAVLHSGLTAAQRHQQWSHVHAGKARLVIGARSAIFAPLHQSPLGMIVVDEEHASDYKQDQLPRYHARDVAIKRAQIEGCPVVLGSATPSLESWVNAIPSSTGASSRHSLWELTKRVAGARLPEVVVVDMAEERRALAAAGGRAAASAWSDQIGPTLRRELARTMRDGGQAILLLNRRGYAAYLCCASSACGWVMRCDDCDASMVLHTVAAQRSLRTGDVVRCHHCLAQKIFPARCPDCARSVRTLAQGTQSVEDELRRVFPEHLGDAAPGALVRVDGDTMESAADYFDALSKFARGDIKVLLGTQMISKGLDFPNVRLVGVVNADTALNLPDFRASERTFQLVSQVAGRAGRTEGGPGLVIVQTYAPDVAAIRFAAAHDYLGFASDELAIRRGATPPLPPISRMARIVVRDKDHDDALHQANVIAAILRGESSPKKTTARTSSDAHLWPAGQSAPAHTQLSAPRAESSSPLVIVGPSPCAIGRIAGQFRFEILITATGSKGRTALQQALADARSAGVVKSDAHTAVDVDPVSLL